MLIPDASLIDPEVTATMPRELSVHTGLDALTHAVEAYVSNAHGPMTDLLALEAVRLVRVNLPRVLAAPGDIDARGGMCLASLYAGMAFSNAILGAVHAMAHSLGGLLDLPHGLCNAILLDHVVRYNYDAVADRYATLGRALGARFDDDAPEAVKKESVLEAFSGFKKAMGLTMTLADLGVTPQAIPELARKALADPCLLTNPREAAQSDLEAIYEDARRAAS